MKSAIFFKIVKKKKIFYEKDKGQARLVNTNLNDDKLKLKYFETNLNYEQFNYYILLYYSTF